MPRITPNLWFSTQAEEAVQHYVDALGDGAVRSVLRYGPESPALEGSVMTVYFELFGQPFVAINGGPDFEGNPEFTFNEAISLEDATSGVRAVPTGPQAALTPPIAAAARPRASSTAAGTRWSRVASPDRAAGSRTGTASRGR